MTREQEIAKVRDRAADAAEERVLDALLPKPRMMGFSTGEPARRAMRDPAEIPQDAARGELDEREIEIEVRACRWAWRSWRLPAWRRCSSSCRACSRTWAAIGTRTQRKLKVKRGAEALVDEEAGKIINEEELKLRARRPMPSRTASCSSTRSTRLRAARKPSAPTSRARACSATCCRWSKAAPSTPSTAHGQDRSRAVHRLGRLPHVQALGSDSGAAGPLPDPRRARLAQGRGLRAHPDRARCVAVAQYRRCWHRRGGARIQRRSGVRRIAEIAFRSTSAPRTSARAACTPSWSGCSTPRTDGTSGHRSPSRARRRAVGNYALRCCSTTGTTPGCIPGRCCTSSAAIAANWARYLERCAAAGKRRRPAARLQAQPAGALRSARLNKSRRQSATMGFTRQGAP
jgi:hypothetical protein